MQPLGDDSERTMTHQSECGWSFQMRGGHWAQMSPNLLHCSSPTLMAKTWVLSSAVKYQYFWEAKNSAFLLCLLNAPSMPLPTDYEQGLRGERQSKTDKYCHIMSTRVLLWTYQEGVHGIMGKRTDREGVRGRSRREALVQIALNDNQQPACDCTTSVTAATRGNTDVNKWVKCKNSPRISHQLLRSNPINSA